MIDSSKNSTSAVGTDRYSAFRLVHVDHPKGELIHYVGSPCSVEEIEKRLAKNVVTHIWSHGAWKKV